MARRRDEGTQRREVSHRKPALEPPDLGPGSVRDLSDGQWGARPPPGAPVFGQAWVRLRWSCWAHLAISWFHPRPSVGLGCSIGPARASSATPQLWSTAPVPDLSTLAAPCFSVALVTTSLDMWRKATIIPSPAVGQVPNKTLSTRSHALWHYVEGNLTIIIM